jgi:hypothetical protein
MKGVVEIYRVDEEGNQELICSEDNLIVDGASEVIADYLSMPSSIAVYENTTKEHILDASNFIIQGAAFGKGRLGYVENAHKYKRHNLIASGSSWTDGFTRKPINRRVSTVNLTRSIETEKNPFDLSSEILNARTDTTKFDEVDGSAILTFSSVLNEDDYLKGAANAPMIFTIDAKYNHEHPLEDHNTSIGGRGVTTLQLNRHGSQLSGSFWWSRVDGDATKRAAVPKSGNTLVKDLGGGWYRLGIVSPSGSNFTDTSSVEATIFPSGPEAVAGTSFTNATPSGGLYLSRPSLNIGAVPVNYYLGDEPIFNQEVDTQAFPVLVSSVGSYMAGSTETDGLYVLNTPGTLRSNVSAYDAVLSLPEKQNPKLNELEPNVLVDYTRNTDIEFDLGHIANPAGYIGKDTYNLLEFCTSSWSKHNSLNPGTFPMTIDSRWISGFLESRPGATASSESYLVSSLDADDWESPVDNETLTYTPSKNNARSLDISGFNRLKYETLGDSVAAGNQDFVRVDYASSSTGEVRYVIGIRKQDAHYLNLYGGVTELGLYALDFKKALPSLSTSSLNRDVDTGDSMPMKLFARKVFSDNIVGVNDLVSSNSKGFTLNSGITINWYLKFL